MSDAKWPDGPWEIVDENYDFGEISIGVRSEAGYYHYATAMCTGDADLSIANLIASAPEMADALRQWQHAEETGDDAEVANARVARDAALSKARGDQ